MADKPTQPVPSSPPVFNPAPRTTGRPKPTRIFVGPGNPLGVPNTPADNTATPLPAVPATVTSTWGLFATALGVSAPADSHRARRAINRIRQGGR